MVNGFRLKKVKFLFLTIILSCLWPRVDSALALTLGILFSLILGNPFADRCSAWSRVSLKVSVMGMGFGIGISSVLAEGRKSILYTFIGISLTLLVGHLIGRMLKVDGNTSSLITFGTAICGGSAIAAMAPVIKARDEEIAISLATVFTLNAAGLVLFPLIGRLLGMPQEVFGVWAALAIHDTSSVVGAAASYGTIALAVATTVKLTRALWITPVALAFSLHRKTGGKIKIPFFILGFIAAALLRSVFPEMEGIWGKFFFLSRRLLVATLFLIGAGLTREVLKKVGSRPFFQGLILWVMASGVTLFILCFSV